MGVPRRKPLLTKKTQQLNLFKGLSPISSAIKLTQEKNIKPTVKYGGGSVMVLGKIIFKDYILLFTLVIFV